MLATSGTVTPAATTRQQCSAEASTQCRRGLLFLEDDKVLLERRAMARGWARAQTWMSCYASSRCARRLPEVSSERITGHWWPIFNP